MSHARAGALELAWAAFAKEGLDRLTDDPAALTVKGRLLKDRAARAAGEERRRLYLQAAEAYRASAALRPGTYPLINAATLAQLAGDEAQAKALAQDVLERIRAAPDEPETPYYRIATRAEALLLLGREGEARAALGEAMAAAPRAWEDHATTLRQFALLIERRGGDTGWLAQLRPPASLHFGGHMSFAPDRHRPDLTARIEEVIAGERIGFGYGALAAGADIIVAEALVARGAELHVLVPGGIECFAERSVMPFGAAWRARFEALLAAAETVRPVRPIGLVPEGAAIAVADEIAMGAALMNAQRLESEGVQLLILPDDDPSEAASGTARALWAVGGRRQRILTAPREADAGAAADPHGAAARLRPLALIAVGLTAPPEDGAAIEAELSSIASALDRETAMAPLIGQAHVVLPFATVADAAAAGHALAEALADRALRLGGHYAAAGRFTDPFTRTVRPAGAAVPIARATLASAPPGTFCVTEDFAAALTVAMPDGPEIGTIGELDARDGGAPIALHALRWPTGS